MQIFGIGRFHAPATALVVAATAFAVAILLAVTTSFASAAGGATSAGGSTFLGRFSTISTIASAVPTSGAAMGDQNPYGVAVVPRSIGALVRGDVLVSNFNDAKNKQGTGSSIVEISPDGQQRVFAVVPPPTSAPVVGLTTALVALRDGFVVVGSLPAPGGNSRKATAGALTVLDPAGQVAATITAPDINGPWDMTAIDHGHDAVLFVTNVLNGTVAAGGNVVHGGTVVRIGLRTGSQVMPAVTSNTVIATGFAEHTDPNALVVGPTGVGFSHGTLYVADSNGNRIAAIPDALTRLTAVGAGGMTVASGGPLTDPLGLVIAPNGNIITANGNDGRVIETSPAGATVDAKTLVPNGAGDLFGLAVAPNADGLYFVNDIGSGPDANSLALLH